MRLINDNYEGVGFELAAADGPALRGRRHMEQSSLGLHTGRRKWLMK